jgi:hypothetical protein
VFNDFHDFECINGKCLEELNPTFHFDCGQDYCENWEYYCQQGDVYKKRNCHDLGCSLGFCYSNVNTESGVFSEDCQYGCANGQCIQECCEDENCPEDYYSNDYCGNNSVYKDFHDFSCLNGSCMEKTNKILVAECQGICLDGECKNIACSDNYDCGSNGFIGEKYCGTNGDVYRDYKIFECLNPGEIESQCSDSINPQVVEECNNGCQNGFCLPAQECYKDSDCGQADSKLVCLGDDINKKIITPKCVNGECGSEIEYDFIKNCDYDCKNGKCQKDNDKNNLNTEDDLCGDDYCDKEKGENEFNCPIDCELVKKAVEKEAEISVSQSYSQAGLANNEIIKLGAKVLGVENSKYAYIPVLLVILVILFFIIFLIVLLLKR